MRFLPILFINYKYPRELCDLKGLYQQYAWPLCVYLAMNTHLKRFQSRIWKIEAAAFFLFYSSSTNTKIFPLRQPTFFIILIFMFLSRPTIYPSMANVYIGSQDSMIFWRVAYR